jgi:hypothetical protein
VSGAVVASICHVSRWSRGACGSKPDKSSIRLSAEKELIGIPYHVSSPTVYLRKGGSDGDGNASPKVPMSPLSAKSYSRQYALPGGRLDMVHKAIMQR